MWWIISAMAAASASMSVQSMVRLPSRSSPERPPVALRRISPPRNLTECDRPAWPRTLEEAKALQVTLARRVRLSRLQRPVRFVGGADASFTGDITVGVIVVLDLH